MKNTSLPAALLLVWSATFVSGCPVAVAPTVSAAEDPTVDESPRVDEMVEDAREALEAYDEGAYDPASKAVDDLRDELARSRAELVELRDELAKAEESRKKCEGLLARLD